MPENSQHCKLCLSLNLQPSYQGSYKLFSCCNCGLNFIDDPGKYLDDDWFDDYFKRRQNDDSDNKLLTELREEQYKIDSKFVSRYLKDNDSVLDIGCSNGKFLSIISGLKKNLNCIGIDIDNFAISEANNNFGKSATYYCHDLISFKAKQNFDLVIFRGTLQYLGDTLLQSLDRLKEILKDQGVIIIFSLPSTDSFMYHLLGHKWSLFHPEMQLMFNESSVRFLAQKYSYKIKSIDYPYLEDVYANPKNDFKNIKEIILGNSKKSNPFWGSIMRVILTN